MTNTVKRTLFSLPYPKWLSSLHQKGIWGILCSCLPPHGLSVVLLTTKGLLIESSRRYLCVAGAQMLWAFDSMLLPNGDSFNGQKHYFPKMKQAFGLFFWMMPWCKRQILITFLVHSITAEQTSWTSVRVELVSKGQMFCGCQLLLRGLFLFVSVATVVTSLQGCGHSARSIEQYEYFEENSLFEGLLTESYLKKSKIIGTW